MINFVHKIPSIACHTPSSLVYVSSLHTFIIFIAFIIDKKRKLNYNFGQYKTLCQPEAAPCLLLITLFLEGISGFLF